ncbi:transcriptional repressor [Clostridium thermosuccinogenes]|uniref:Transcriptional repressor n=1 Tax=Clostridium thermosuccinogenes TaxID=84032 RepID=A0A2K2F5G9_9CLOT|nr:Fur family transcriptional regulator [Pseudoclostridium thermosuccinogenes]AUS97790.1 transcriptional repressor [Pseudoclostridium thermosuccinogenes]PNT94031.1 transcriptional repressor [Pseudoclostridium thermosuccinogenes]PNT95874.1 transcriptional repressor [Pseudoclostridium thermosuccinogenes]PNT97224.1 transcriptional repressor [Pseudoclostridium thermosuccinogenes]
MKANLNELTEKLKSKNIRLSHQRLKVLEYVAEHRTHPTVDQVYSDLHREIPTLSKTTVYNTLNALMDAGLVKVITIEDNETRYDIVTENHGHFKCQNCGRIYDFKIDIDSFEAQDLKDFKILDKDVYFKGICPHCINN